tara:strand:- start:1642 stop:2976 length:1335 start_codon:yes stop_codon:yes gene_type:complete
MARRGFGGTALRAALGAVTGVAEGLQQRDVVAAEKKRMADAAAMDRARLLMQLNYRVAPDEYDTIDPAARSILPSLEMPSAAPPSATRAGGALSAALNRGFGVDATKPSLSRPSFGSAPLELDSRTTRMTEVLGRGQEARAAQEAIAASVDLGGGMKVRFNAPESDDAKLNRELKKYEAQFGVQEDIEARKAQRGVERQRLVDEEKVKALMLAGVPDEQARAGIAMGAQFRDLIETPESRRKAEMDYRNLSLNERRYALEIAKYNSSEQERAVKAAEALDKKKAALEGLSNVLPTISKANKTLSSWTDKELNQLSPEGVNAAMVANMSSTTPQGIATSWLLNKTLVSSLDREYAQYARATADAVARASEVGVLTNQDVARYQNQVAFVAGDDPATKRRKFDALKSWGLWLETQKSPLLQGNRRSLLQIPGESPSEALARLRGGQ